MTDEKFKELEEKYHAEVERRRSKIRLGVMLKDLEHAKEERTGYNTVCCHLTSEEQEKLYVFLKNMFEEELKDLDKDENNTNNLSKSL